MIRRLIGSMLLAGLAGCGTVRYLPSGYAHDTQDNQGLAIVSLTLSGRPLGEVSSFEYRVRSAPAGVGGEVRTKPRFTSARQHARSVAENARRAAPRMTVVVKGTTLAEAPDVIESGEAVGRAAVLRLPAGSYEFYTWKIVRPGAYGAEELSPQHAMAYRFEVTAGRASYVGRLNLHITDRGSYQLTADDQADRDVALVAQKLPFLSTANIVHQSGELRR
jgi:hypothetical protein